CRRWIIRRCSRRSPSGPGPSTTRRSWPDRWTRPSGWRPARTAGRCSWTSRSRRSTARPRRTCRLPARLRWLRGRRPGRPARVVHVADAPGGIATHVPLAASAAGDLAAFFTALTASGTANGTGAGTGAGQADPEWITGLAEATRAALASDEPLLASEADPVHPSRIYGELLKVLDDDAVVIGDGGDFVSFAGKYIEPLRPGGWLDPGPFGCLGTGLGYAIAARVARPSAQVVLLLGDGAAGFSLMDADTLVRHGLPVVMVCGNNAGWGLERHPMRALYG